METRARRRLRGDRNRCSTCGEYFNSTTAFDKHRAGEPPNRRSPLETRRCLIPAEMRALGMVLNAAGWWVTKLRDSAPSLPRRSGDRLENDPMAGSA
jgi:hypothetical protein